MFSIDIFLVTKALTVGRVQWPTNENRKCLLFEVAKTLFEAAEILFIKGKL